MTIESARQRQSRALRGWGDALELNNDERLLPHEVWGILVAICDEVHIKTSELIAPMLSAYREAESWSQENLVGGQRLGHRIKDLRERVDVSLLLLEGSS